MANKASLFSQAMRHAATTGERNHIQGAFRRAAIAGSKVTRLKPSEIRAQRLKAAVNETRRQQQIRARNQRFKVRLSRVKAAASKGVRGARRGEGLGSSDNR